MEVTKMISQYNFSYNNNPYYIVIHDVGTVSSAYNNAIYFNNGDRGASAHYFIDKISKYQVVEEYNKSWHCGDGNNYYGINNGNSIGIEMCLENDYSVSPITIDNTIELVKELMNKYNIPSDRVVRHYDASRKLCPKSLSYNNWQGWDDFKSKLTTQSKPKNIFFDLNDLTVTNDVLNLRGWFVANTSNKITNVYINDKFIGQCTQGAKREDVKKAYPTFKDGLNSGFTYQTSGIAMGKNTLKLEFYNKDTGEIELMYKDFERVNIPMRYDLNDLIVDNNQLYLRGWFVAKNVKAINVYIDKEFKGQCKLGLERKDVLNAYPQYNSLNSGYIYELHLDNLNSGTHKLTLEFVDTNGQVELMDRNFEFTKVENCNHSEIIEKLKKENEELQHKLENIKNIIK